MPEEVQYTMSLKDLLSEKLRGADHAAHGLESTIDRVKEGLGLLGIGFAVFKGVEFIHEGIEAVHRLHQATAQVEAGLKSTGEAAGLTFKDIQDGAKKLSAGILYGRTDILEMQSILLTFPAVTKDSFEPASAIIADMSTRLGVDLKGTAIQVGKALQDPIKGVTALRKVGVNFSEAQTQMIAKLVATGQAAKAQQLILGELTTEFGGSARAAFNADPAARFNKMMEAVKIGVGELAEELLEKLIPGLEWFGQKILDGIEGLKEGAHWLHKHEDGVTALAIGIGAAALAYGAYQIKLAAVSAFTFIYNGYLWAQAAATLAVGTEVGILTIAQLALNTAMRNNPVGIIITVIGLVIGAIVYAAEKFDGFRAVLWGVWGVIKEFGKIVGDMFGGLWHVIHGVFTFNKNEISQGMDQQLGALKDSGTRLGAAFQKGYNESLEKDQIEKDTAKIKAIRDEQAKKKKAGATVKGDTGDDGKGAPKVKGNQSTTINIDIKEMNGVKAMTITEAIEGTYKDIGRLIANELLKAVNDSGIVANI